MMFVIFRFIDHIEMRIVEHLLIGEALIDYWNKLKGCPCKGAYGRGKAPLNFG